ncbi:hypothetical protein N7488_000201 [Penicillium malachiteum]|nr:hypothetical protein N7488_000201 [Penicillium malachiteum]
MRSKLDWKSRKDSPKVAIGVDLLPPIPFLGVWLEAEAEAYLYGNGRMPFYGTQPPTKPYGNLVSNGRTVVVYMGVCRDSLVPSSRPLRVIPEDWKLSSWDQRRVEELSYI